MLACLLACLLAACLLACLLACSRGAASAWRLGVALRGDHRPGAWSRLRRHSRDVGRAGGAEGRSSPGFRRVVRGRRWCCAAGPWERPD
ncbi:hypothetical protein FFG40_001360 [Curtobacterium sp. KBS0715]|nr:hypothetical protein FFG40_001360 [Curtobacterium sp. KBS0715]